MRCKECLQEKDLSEFYKHPQMPSGHLNFCKECKRKYARNNRSKEDDKKRYRSNPKRRLNVIFHGMMSRCYDKNNNHYRWYGGKGIKVQWNSYKEFYKDMLEGYEKHRREFGSKNNRQTQIDRIDNKGDYSKENCRRVTAKGNNENNK